jgi:hypothetical protein
MANRSLDQFAHLKQPACDYLSQVYQISQHLQDLKEALEELLFVIHAFLKSGHKVLDKNLIPVSTILNHYIFANRKSSTYYETPLTGLSHTKDLKFIWLLWRKWR